MEQGLKGIFALFGGLALFLYGMDALSRSLETAAGQRMKRLLMVLAGSPVRGVLAGAAVTAVLLGDNIGTTVTAVLASIGQSRDTKRAAAAHALFNLTGAAAFCALLPWYAGLVAMISPKGPELEVIARQLAIAHTLFNLVCTAVWLPLTPLMVRLVCGLVPDRPPKARNS